MKTIKLSDFCKANGITAISNVRENTNGYPYVTMLAKEGEETVAENIYFSKSSASEVALGQAIASIADKISVADTENAAGEARKKLTFGNHEYADVAALFN